MGIHPNTDHPDAISLPPGTILGYRADGRPIHVIAGGAETDDEPDIEVEVDDEPEAETDEEPEPDEAPKPKPPAQKTEPKPEDDDYTPPSKTEWAKAQAALKKANEDAKRHRLRNKELEDKARGDESEHEKALREAREEGERRYRAPLVQTAARSALVEAGALAFLQDEKDPESQGAREKGESRLKRLLKLVDTDALDVDDDGSVSGLEAAVDELRRDYPELFSAPARRVKARPTGAPRPAAVEQPKSTAERHAQRILGKA
ncbi:hypothetical protein [Streptomyces sp. LUP30]|uniref:hypothetical protein n=2 Tax=unclassified Streptomyces TaxID=2593676 RepID=UPI000AED850E|nr:hypothetical protein [Streptomyces sp. LUP30]